MIHMAGTDLDGIHADLLKVLDLPPGALATLMDLLWAGADLNPLNAPDLLGISGLKIEPLLRLLGDEGPGHDCLLVSLRASAAAARRAAERRDECALCWTGPPSLDVVERSTDSIVREMIEGAREEILIVGYRITGGGGVAGRLADALRRTVDITIIIDDDGGGANRSALDGIFYGPRRPRIYAHKKKEEAFYKVHAKIMIVDRKELLVTSANLTHHGLVQNFEMGVRIRGRTVGNAHAVIRKMIDSGYFEAIS